MMMKMAGGGTTTRVSGLCFFSEKLLYRFVQDPLGFVRLASRFGSTSSSGLVNLVKVSRFGSEPEMFGSSFGLVNTFRFSFSTVWVNSVKPGQLAESTR
ncbi:hypothetical protein Hdeb2414_s0009g00324241 [Helianthus debilis subsp. tardiflorus]